MALLSIRAVEKTYSAGLFSKTKGRALRGVDLDVERGCTFGLIGPNGAGKTTLIKTILAVLQPTRGTVKVFGASPEQVDVRRRIGYLPERLDFPRGMSPLQFLASVARIKKVKKPGPEIDRQLERVGLSAHRKQRVDRFSKGMRQRLGLAAAFLSGPELLILDEPTDGLDPMGRVEIRRLLLEEQQRGTTVFLNSHLLAETEKICERVGILHEGRLILEGALDALVRRGLVWRMLPNEGADEAALLEAGFSLMDDHSWRIEVESSAALNRSLDQVRSRGVEILELHRETKTLESILAEHVGG